MTELTIKETISGGDLAAIWFENRTAAGVVDSCDWVRVEGDTIREIRSFYDSAKVREILAPTDQQSLDGAY